MDLWVLCCLVWEALQDGGLKSQLGRDRCLGRTVLAGMWASMERVRVGAVRSEPAEMSVADQRGQGASGMWDAGLEEKESGVCSGCG